MYFVYLFQILFDFDLLYPEADSTAIFGDAWNNIKSRIYTILEDGVDGSKYPLQDENFLDFLYLLKFFSIRTKLETAANSFIKMSEVLKFSCFHFHFH